MSKQLFANSEDPDQTLCSVASDLGLHCLQITLLVFITEKNCFKTEE